MQKWFFVFAAFAIFLGGSLGFAANESAIYTNKENGFSIRFPSSWEIKEGAGGMAVQAVGPVQGAAPRTVRPSLSVTVETVPQTTTIDEYVSRGIEKARSTMPDFKVYRMGRQTISRSSSRWWVISYQADSITVKGLLFLVVKGGRAYRIVGVAPLEKYASYKDLLANSAGSLLSKSLLLPGEDSQRGGIKRMNEVVEQITKEKPHLADVFRFYDRTVQFFDSVRELVPAPGPSRTAYPTGMLDSIFERFLTFIEQPEGSLDPLKRAMELDEIDFTRLPLGEVPAFSLPYAEDDLTMLLFLVSRPYFIALRESSSPEEGLWEEGRCPVCKAQPSVTWIGDSGRRLASCSYCGATGQVTRAGCPVCQTVDKAKQKTLVFEREEGFKINTCDLCRSYVKTIDAGLIKRLTPEVADLASLPLDIVVQEKGYARRSPNPVGMRKISTRG